ncbi:glycerol-3-phosphate acyltransferase [Anaerocolumna sp. MB42-C2]|uniref:glycerol-3-phosphate acyltransferase n=1 Tax=Anaerocolumna sp. MB42-C2 TaxID=3070997 RepID=UPI0027E151D6|nr:glycerol-3-phosphate acyltransferase [Anaerocolumna sp. MB42-C2]WMJ87507.1 glycerol-3-phosphate acyltransferase [Anaerocolumna sp. MB42-C2]
MGENNLILLLFILMEYLCGSLMFSYWLGLAVKKDLKTIGDGNPGAFNLWNAAGYKLGLLGVLLDFMKGYLPLVFLYESGVLYGYWLVPVALAPIVGHVFPAFTRFKGGKAIAVTFGVWSAISGFKVSFLLAVILAFIQLMVRLLNKGKTISSDEDGVLVVCGMIILGICLKVTGLPVYYIGIWFGNQIIFLYANRGKLYRFWKEKNFLKIDGLLKH